MRWPLRYVEGHCTARKPGSSRQLTARPPRWRPRTTDQRSELNVYIPISVLAAAFAVVSVVIASLVRFKSGQSSRLRTRDRAQHWRQPPLVLARRAGSGSHRVLPDRRCCSSSSTSKLCSFTVGGQRRPAGHCLRWSRWRYSCSRCSWPTRMWRRGGLTWDYSRAWDGRTVARRDPAADRREGGGLCPQTSLWPATFGLACQ